MRSYRFPILFYYKRIYNYYCLNGVSFKHFGLRNTFEKPDKIEFQVIKYIWLLNSLFEHKPC